MSSYGPKRHLIRRGDLVASGAEADIVSGHRKSVEGRQTNPDYSTFEDFSLFHLCIYLYFAPLPLQDADRVGIEVRFWDRVTARSAPWGHLDRAPVQVASWVPAS
jgi:hypothetical protein